MNKDGNLFGLLHFLKAPSKHAVVACCSSVVASLGASPSEGAAVTKQIVDEVGTSRSEADELLASLTYFLRRVFYEDVGGDPTAMRAFFPSDGFDPKLRDLLCKITVDNAGAWRAKIVADQVSLPKLSEFEWEVRDQSGVLAPSCLLTLKTTDGNEERVEMSKETLDTMLDSLARIRQQISSVVQ